MTIFVTSSAALLAMLSLAGDGSYTVDDFQYGLPRPTTAAEKAANSNANTRIAVKFADSSTRGKGWRFIYYDRLDLGSLSNADVTGMKFTVGQTTAQIIPLLRRYIGVVLTADDLVDRTSANDTGGVTFVAEAKSTSLGWIGSVAFVIADGPNISTAFPDDKLDGF